MAKSNNPFKAIGVKFDIGPSEFGRLIGMDRFRASKLMNQDTVSRAYYLLGRYVLEYGLELLRRIAKENIDDGKKQSDL